MVEFAEVALRQGWKPGQVRLPNRCCAHDVMQTLARHDDIVVADASFSSNWILKYLGCRRGGQRFLVPRGLAGLGWGLPMDLGARIAQPDSRIFCLVGDGLAKKLTISPICSLRLRRT